MPQRSPEGKWATELYKLSQKLIFLFTFVQNQQEGQDSIVPSQPPVNILQTKFSLAPRQAQTETRLHPCVHSECDRLDPGQLVAGKLKLA